MASDGPGDTQGASIRAVVDLFGRPAIVLTLVVQDSQHENKAVAAKDCGQVIKQPDFR